MFTLVTQLKCAHVAIFCNCYVDLILHLFPFKANSERIEARRLEENEAVASILEEVLASSSPELANIQDADAPPMP